jgi:hypothetical protein
MHACAAAQRNELSGAYSASLRDSNPQNASVGLRGVRCFEGLEVVLGRPSLPSARVRTPSISPMLGIAQWRHPFRVTPSVRGASEWRTISDALSQCRPSALCGSVLCGSALCGSAWCGSACAGQRCAGQHCAGQRCAGQRCAGQRCAGQRCAPSALCAVSVVRRQRCAPVSVVAPSACGAVSVTRGRPRKPECL